MKIHHRHSRPNRRGMAVLAMVVATFSVVSVLAVMLTLASFSNERADTERHATEARYLAMGAVEAAKRELTLTVANWRPVPENGVVEIAGEQVEYTITFIDDMPTQIDDAGIQTMVQAYELSSIGTSRDSRQPVMRLVNVDSMPLFQFAVFYNSDLEVNPGPNMTINGRVHSNGNMHLGSGNTLLLNTNYVRAVGRILRHRKDAPGTSDGTVRMRRWVPNPFNGGTPVEYVTMLSHGQLSAAGVASVSGYDSNFATSIDGNGDGFFFGAGDWPAWGPGALHFWGAAPVAPGDLPPDLPVNTGYTVLDQTHGTTHLAVPQMGSIAMFEPATGGDYVWDGSFETYLPVAAGTGTHSKGFFHDQAGLSILVNEDGTWEAFNEHGGSMSAQLAGVVTVKEIYDARQANSSGDLTRVLEIDMELLNASGAFPPNGLLYASHYGLGTGIDAKGIKLVNGSELAASLTVVSEGSIYVEGDYNTDNKKSAAVIADAVNLLSNSWDDSKTPGSLPVASHTTYNVAIVTGNSDTSVGTYNGGFENLPRFHENWSGRDCNIRGSFVNLSTSQFATGAWVYGSDRYQAPRRNWSYDPLFNSAPSLPPFTPVAVRVRDIASW